MSEREKLDKIREIIDSWDEQCVDADNEKLKELDYKYMCDIKRFLQLEDGFEMSAYPEEICLEER